MLILADYLFYRLATKGDRETGGSRAGLLVGLLWTLLILVPIAWLIQYLHELHWIQHPSDLLTGVFIIIWVPLSYVAFRRYANAYDRLHSRWEADTLQQKTRKTILSLSVVLVVLYLVYAVMHNLAV